MQAMLRWLVCGEALRGASSHEECDFENFGNILLAIGVFICVVTAAVDALN